MLIGNSETENCNAYPALDELVIPKFPLSERAFLGIGAPSTRGFGFARDGVIVSA